MSTAPTPSRPPLWRDPAMIGIVVVVIAAGGWILFENKIVKPKPVDITTRVPLAGGGAFCDPVPLPRK